MNCRWRDGAPPADSPRTRDVKVTSENDGDAISDDALEIGDLSDVDVDHEDKRELLRLIR